MDEAYVLHRPTYEWTVKLFSRLRKVLGINIKLHGDPALLEQGEIFLFNHFAHVETFLPHYLIYQETGAFCRCIATKRIFEGNEAFRKYLSRVGVIPNDHDELLPMLVAEIIRGRKVIIFPEGGIVKDRRVIDDKGKFNIYSSKAKTYRKHHAGAAVLATAVDTFKLAVLTAEKNHDWERIDAWVEMLEIKNREHLLFSARRLTQIIPGNITFYPINSSDNFLHKGAELLNTELSPGANEELIIEANLLLKNTDMDMRLGNPICLADYKPWWERRLQKYLARNLCTVEDFFTLKGLNKPWVEKIIRNSIRHSCKKLRDNYMASIYKEVTINLSHLASTIILGLLDKNIMEIETKRFYLMVYLAVKHSQQQPKVHLHRSLKNPEVYTGLVNGDDEVLKQFLEISIENGLIELTHGRLNLLEKLKTDFELNSVRIENTMQVYANEMATIEGAVNAANKAIDEAELITDRTLANYRYDDELRSYDWNHHYFSKTRFDDINRQESATESGRPFFFIPKKASSTLGLVLVHGFLASPAEVKPFADKLVAAGYPVYGVRLPGHGTSPVDLRERCWEDWLHAVKQGYEILSAYADQICLIGFSTGGILSLIYAAEQPQKLAGVVVINPPVKLKNKNIKFVPILHGVSRFMRWSSSLESITSYRSNNTEHPRINYQSIPLKGLHELVRMNQYLNKQLDSVDSPCLLLQSIDDPVIDANSSKILQDGLLNANVSYVAVESNRHGILYEDEGNTHELTMNYIQQLINPLTDKAYLHKEKLQWES